MDDRWERVREAVARNGARFIELTRTGDPAAMATREWTVADSAAHLLSIVSWYATKFAADEGQADRTFSTVTVDTLKHANAKVLTGVPQRDPERLATELRSSLDRLLEVSAGCDPARSFRWLGDSLLPAAGVLAHLMNEFLVHGWDMARALDRDWPIEDADSALFVELFLVGMIRLDTGTLLETDARPPAKPIAVEFRSAHTDPVTIVLEGRRVHVGGPHEHADARVTFRPAGFLLYLFGRTSLPRALLHRDLKVGGPRPWLLPAYLRVMHLPNN